MFVPEPETIVKELLDKLPTANVLLHGSRVDVVNRAHLKTLMVSWISQLEQEHARLVEEAKFEARGAENDRIGTMVFDAIELDGNDSDGCESADAADHIIRATRAKFVRQQEAFDVALASLPTQASQGVKE